MPDVEIGLLALVIHPGVGVRVLVAGRGFDPVCSGRPDQHRRLFTLFTRRPAAAHTELAAAIGRILLRPVFETFEPAKILQGRD